MNYTTASDEELAFLGRQGDAQALAELRQRLGPAMRACLTGGASAEQAQRLADEALTQAVERFDPAAKATFLPWLDHVVNSLVRDKASAEQQRNGQARTMQPGGTATAPGAVRKEVYGTDFDLDWVATWEARSHFGANRAKFPWEKLVPFYGQTIAWAPDGASIVDSAPDFGTLWDKLLARGETPSIYIYEDIEAPEYEALPVALRLPHKPTQLAPDHVLYPYWGALGYHRPTIDVILRARSGQVVQDAVLLDSGSPYILFDESIAHRLGLSPPFTRLATGQAAGGSPLLLSFPDDGEVALFISDFRTGFYAWLPLVGFLRPPQTGGPPKKQTSLLGITGFFQYFDVSFPDPEIVVDAKPNFPGLQGGLPLPADLWARVQPPSP